MRVKPVPHDQTDPADYDSRRGGHLENRRVALIAETIARTGATSVLELGGGTGRITYRVALVHPDINFMVVEPDERMALWGAQNYSGTGIIRTRGLPDEFFADLLFSIDVIHHLKNRRSVFAQMRAVAGRGATWIVVEPNIYHPYMRYSQGSMKRRGFDEDHFRPKICEPEFGDCGWRIGSKTYMHLWPASFEPSERAKGLERRLEHVQRLGGSVVYGLIAS